MRYEYRMVQVPPTIEANPRDEDTGARYLQDIVDRYTSSADGWEFYRVDSIGVFLPDGCFLAIFTALLEFFFGRQGPTVTYYVITFRKVLEGDTTASLINKYK